jgi:hypothetical protein
MSELTELSQKDPNVKMGVRISFVLFCFSRFCVQTIGKKKKVRFSSDVKDPGDVFENSMKSFNVCVSFFVLFVFSY